MWSCILKVINIINDWEGTNLIICYDKWISQSSEFSTLPTIVCWNIWLERNRAIFEDTNPTVESIVFKSCGSFNKSSMTMKVALPRTIQSIQLTRETAGFFYGVVLANGTNSGVGGVITLSDKSSITRTCNYGPGTNTR